MVPNQVTPVRWTRRAFGHWAGAACLGASSGVAGFWGGVPLAGFAADQATVRKQLLARSESPYNAEPALGHLVESHVTPLEHFFVRSHGAVPRLDKSAFTVSVEGMVRRPLKLTLAELEARFPQHTVEATLTCAGNRRTELSALKPVAGVAWDCGAIGHAEWTGVSLADVLAAAEPLPGGKHVWFEGADPIKEKDGSEAPFGGSIPMAKAHNQGAHGPGALVATRMNGQPLLPEHGAPFRTVVPGFIGARSVKWLQKIVVSDRTSPNHYLADVYKIVQTDTPAERAATPPIYEFPVNGVICTPASGSKLSAGSVRVAGFALPTGAANCTVKQVDLSVDGGRTWRAAQLAGPSRPYCWQLWSAEVPVGPGTTKLTVRVRDSLGHVQPEAGSWNFKGYLFNGWHHCPVKVS